MIDQSLREISDAQKKSDLVKVRWLTGFVGFLCTVPLPLLMLICRAAPHLFAPRLTRWVGAGPMPAITEWFLSVMDVLPTGGLALEGLLGGTFLFAFGCLLIAILRANNVASIGLRFAVWIGMLLSFELLAVVVTAFALLLPLAPSIGPLKRIHAVSLYSKGQLAAGTPSHASRNVLTSTGKSWL